MACLVSVYLNPFLFLVYSFDFFFFHLIICYYFLLVYGVNAIQKVIIKIYELNPSNEMGASLSFRV